MKIATQPLSCALVGTTIAAVLFACSNDVTEPTIREFTGAQIAVGAGVAWTEMSVGVKTGVQSVTLVFTEGALSNLPATLPNTEYIIPLPSDAPASAFNHVGINWQPQGHPPPMVYTVPHFDVHYYMVSTQERDAMTPADPQFGAKSTRTPLAAETPPGFASDPFAVPRMGAHWTDVQSHEFHGSPFTSTIVYGFYDGKMVFIEPMMTKAYLESKPNDTKAIRVPAAYPKPGRYPTSYRVVHDAATKRTRIELTGFENRG